MFLRKYHDTVLFVKFLKTYIETNLLSTSEMMRPFFVETEKESVLVGYDNTIIIPAQ